MTKHKSKLIRMLKLSYQPDIQNDGTFSQTTGIGPGISADEQVGS
ncbi:hypothetical protein [Catalinimonas niigatensis]|nr:hypothetical protein [Catalinimonas niigatensis]WPP53742.1 hypothetical protein PZB72_01875 [Catalinimonas niigatensis]